MKYIVTRKQLLESFKVKKLKTQTLNNMNDLITESKLKKFIDNKLGDKINIRVIKNITEFPFEYDFFKSFPKIKFYFPIYELLVGDKRYLAFVMEDDWRSEDEFENEWVVIKYNEKEFNYSEDFLEEKDLSNLGLSLKDIIEIYLS
jgi:RNA recognition motif-containing protein